MIFEEDYSEKLWVALKILVDKWRIHYNNELWTKYRRHNGKTGIQFKIIRIKNMNITGGQKVET